MRQLLRAGALITVLMTGMCFTGNGLAQDLKIATVDIQALTLDRKSTRLNSSHSDRSRMPSSA